MIFEVRVNDPYIFFSFLQLITMLATVKDPNTCTPYKKNVCTSS